MLNTRNCCNLANILGAYTPMGYGGWGGGQVKGSPLRADLMARQMETHCTGGGGWWLSNIIHFSVGGYLGIFTIIR